MTLKYTSVPSKRLASLLSSTGTTFKINNILSWDGVTELSASDFGTEAYGVFRNVANTKLEFFKWNPVTVADAEITIVARGLGFDGGLSTEITANKKDWLPNETIVELGSDVSQLFQYLQEYIDNAIVSGAADAALGVKGLVEEATTAEINAGTANGDGNTSAPLAVTAEKLNGSIYQTQLPTVEEKAAMAGGGNLGSPGSNNKFQTPGGVSKIINDLSAPKVVVFETSGTYTKPSNLKYIEVELVGAGGKGSNGLDGFGNNIGGHGGSAGGYAKKIILASALSSGETVSVGVATGTRTTSFGAFCSATGGVDAPDADERVYGSFYQGGIGSNGDINLRGGSVNPNSYTGNSPESRHGARGGLSQLGAGANYGGGGDGGYGDGFSGSNGGNGVVIITEYFV